MEGQAFNTVSFYVCPVNPQQINPHALTAKYIIQEDTQIKEERIEKEVEELCKILSPETKENLNFGEKCDTWSFEFLDNEEQSFCE